MEGYGGIWRDLQGCRVAWTGMQGCRDAGMQGCRDAGLQGCRDAGLQGCRVAGLQGWRSSDRLNGKHLRKIESGEYKVGNSGGENRK